SRRERPWPRAHSGREPRHLGARLTKAQGRWPCRSEHDAEKEAQTGGWASSGPGPAADRTALSALRTRPVRNRPNPPRRRRAGARWAALEGRRRGRAGARWPAGPPEPDPFRGAAARLSPPNPPPFPARVALGRRLGSSVPSGHRGTPDNG